jgi:hypothetical protein
VYASVFFFTSLLVVIFLLAIGLFRAWIPQSVLWLPYVIRDYWIRVLFLTEERGFLSPTERSVSGGPPGIPPSVYYVLTTAVTESTQPTYTYIRDLGGGNSFLGNRVAGTQTAHSSPSKAEDN